MPQIDRAFVEHRVTGGVTQSLDRILARVRSEYREMPGLSLTPAQARRLFGLNESDCHSALERLETEGFLRRTRRQMYCLAREV